MVFRSLLTLVGAFFLLSFSHPAHAVDQLPLPDATRTLPQGEIIAFVNTKLVESSAQACAFHLKNNVGATSDKIRALKLYRQCRADFTLQQLATVSRQDTVN